MASKYTMPDHFKSIASKQKPEWYKPLFEYYASIAMENRDSANLTRLQGLFNGDLSKDDYHYILNPYNFKEERHKNLPGRIRNFDIVSPVWRRFMGEYSQAPNQFQVVASNPTSENQMLVEKNNMVNDQLRTMSVNALNGAGVDTGMETKEVPNLKEKVEGFISTWRDKRAALDQENLDVLNYLTGDEMFRYRVMSDWINYGECYSHRDVHNDDVVKEYIPVEEYYPIENGEEFVEDHDAGLRVTKMTMFQILDKFSNRFTDKEINRIKELIKTYDSGNKSINPTAISDTNNIETAVASTSLDSSKSIKFSDDQGYMEVYRLVFKTYKKIGILTYIDNDGNIAEIEVSSSYKLNIPNGDLELLHEDVPVVMDMYRFGNESLGMYVKPIELVVQRHDLNNRHICKLPFNGKVRLFPGFPNHSILEILLPYQIFINILYLVRERAIARNHGKIGIFPKGLLGSDDLSQEEQMYMMLADGKLFADDSFPNFGVAVSGLKSIDLSDHDYITSLTALINETKQSANDDVDMNRQRLGETQSSDGKYTTQQALYRSALGSAIIIEVFNKFLEVDYNSDLDYSKVAWIDGKKGEYLTSDKHVAFYSIDGPSHSETNYGVFCKHNQLEQEKLNQLRDLAFSAGQNGELTLAAESVNANNASKLRDIIKRYEEVSKNRAERSAKNEQESAMAVAQQEQATEEAKLENDRVINEQNNEVKFRIKELDILIEEMKISSKDRAVDIQAQIEDKRLGLERYLDDNKKVTDTAVNSIQSPVI